MRSDLILPENAFSFWFENPFSVSFLYFCFPFFLTSYSTLPRVEKALQPTLILVILWFPTELLLKPKNLIKTERIYMHQFNGKPGICTNNYKKLKLL